MDLAVRALRRPGAQVLREALGARRACAHVRSWPRATTLACARPCEPVRLSAAVRLRGVLNHVVPLHRGCARCPQCNKGMGRACRGLRRQGREDSTDDHDSTDAATSSGQEADAVVVRRQLAPLDITQWRRCMHEATAAASAEELQWPYFARALELCAPPSPQLAPNTRGMLLSRIMMRGFQR